MNPDELTTEEGQRKFSVAFNNIGGWIEEQKRNKQVGRMEIDSEHLIEIVSDFLSAVRNMHMLETNVEKKLELSEIEAKPKDVLGGLGLINDLYEQVDIYAEAKRLLLDVHREAKKLLLKNE